MKRVSGAFTLIELLVVIAIIALLVSILLPSLAGARDLARTTTCLTNLRAIAQADAQYTQNNNEFLFVAGYNLKVWEDSPLDDERGWPELLAMEKLIDLPTSSQPGQIAASSVMRCASGGASLKPWGWNWGSLSNAGYEMKTAGGDYYQGWYQANGEDWNGYMFPHSQYEASGSGRKYMHRLDGLRKDIPLSSMVAVLDGPLMHQHQGNRIPAWHARGRDVNVGFLDGSARSVSRVDDLPLGSYWDFANTWDDGGEVLMPINKHGSWSAGRQY